MTEKFHYGVDEAEELLNKIKEILPEENRNYGVLANVISATLTLELFAIQCGEDFEQEQSEIKDFDKARQHLRTGWKHLRFRH